MPTRRAFPRQSADRKMGEWSPDAFALLFLRFDVVLLSRNLPPLRDAASRERWGSLRGFATSRRIGPAPQAPTPPPTWTRSQEAGSSMFSTKQRPLLRMRLRHSKED